MAEIRVLSLTDAADVPPDVVGPKASSLSRLARVPLPVPPAFCITTRAYLDHLERRLR